MRIESVPAAWTRSIAAGIVLVLLSGGLVPEARAAADPSPTTRPQAATATAQAATKLTATPAPPRPAAAARKPWGRAEYIAYLESGKRLAPLEGIWVLPGGSAEIAIAQYAPGTGGEFEYFGVVVASTSLHWPNGLPALFVKSTATPSVFIGSWTRGAHQGGATLFLNDPNVIEVVGADGKDLLVRLYPKANATPGAGTGFFVSRRLVATNNHVVDEAKTIKVRVGDVEAPAELVLRDPGNDLALLRLKSDGALDSTLAARGERCAVLGDPLAVKPGDRIYTLGYPLGELLGKALKVSEGIVSSTTGLRNDPTVFQVSVPIQPGSSGSPVFDASGRVVAIVTGTLNARAMLTLTGAAPQNVNFAVKSMYLRTLLSFLSDASCTTPVNARSLSAAEIQQAMGSTVVQVRVGD